MVRLHFCMRTKSGVQGTIAGNIHGVCRLSLFFLLQEICNFLLRFRLPVAFAECFQCCFVPLRPAEWRHEVQQHLCLLDALVGHGCQAPCQLLRANQQLVVGNSLVDQTDPGSLRPGHGATIQEYPARFLESHNLREPPHGPRRSPSQLDFRHGQVRSLRSNPKIVIKGESKSAAEHVAMKCGNLKLTQTTESGENQGESKLAFCGLVGRHWSKFAQIAAGAECPTFAMRDHCSDIRTLSELLYISQK